ncbi:alanine racemase [Phytomonospora endophytica]|uniref:Diaminopimelate decarboxylase n=1 Tax=Phytomonospora endophytica TaxID=714109 RepID=A0A841FIX2_9ACTN|nr:alanine racemase [Phytomonospora endophytica]MBB6035824.1 diaminopimelate decarboxylase [Phytomonospora endophytica]GIG71466.1 diaminopimelate decarboxylase [Phytomonospora endophytica]
MTIPAGVLAAIGESARPVCVYVYDLDAFTERIAATRAALPPGTRLMYAMKANPFPAVVARAAHECDGIEVASGGELTLALTMGARSIVFGGPAKTDEELAAAIDASVRVDLTVNVESVHEARRLDRLASATGRVVPVALRVNRRAAVPEGSHQMTGTPTPFGIDVAELPAAVELVRGQPGLDFRGWHLHAMSNNLDADAHADFIAGSLRFARSAERRLGVSARVLNIGGGIGVDPAGGRDFDLARFAARARRLGRGGPELVAEPGRYLIGEAGWYAAEVLDLKRNHGRTFAVLRGGTHHLRLPAAWGYSHPAEVLPVEEWDYPWPRPEVTDTVVDVTGELCTPRDVLARGLPVGRLRVGDVLVFGRVGAYGWSISHHDFLSHPHPEMRVVVDQSGDGTSSG